MAMTLIEGIGDEVIEFFIGLIIVVIGAVAWWSTRIADRPLIRTVLVFERRSHSSATTINNHHHHHHRQGSSAIEERRSTSITNDQRDYVQDLATVPLESASSGEQQSREEENKPPETATTRSNNLEENNSCNHLGNGSGDSAEISSTSRIEDEEQRDILESMDSEDACVLRRRRLDFFQNNRQEPLITSSSSNSNVDNNIHNEEIITETADVKPNLQNAENATSSPNNLEAEEDIRIKLKYINDDLKMVNGKLKEPLGDFKRRHFEYELNNDKLVRLIFNGQVLQRDDLTLQGCGLFDNCVVHCLVHQKKSNANDRTASNSNLNSGNNSTSSSGGSSSSTNSDRPRMASNAHNQGRDRDLGNLFFAIITFLLGAAWYFRYEYAQLYTVTATVALVGLTGIFTVLLVGMYYPENPVQPVRS